MRTDRQLLREPAQNPRTGGGAAAADLPPSYLPRCPDCTYDLSNLPDGRCPECGLFFTHERLLRAWIARQQKADDRLTQWKSTGLLLLGIAASLALFVLATSNTYLGFGICLAVLAVALGVFCFARGDSLLSSSHELLLFVVPLVILFFSIAVNEKPYPGMAIAAACAAAICFFALRNSPLISGLAILMLGAAPIALYGLSMHSHGRSRRLAGHYWSDFDWPAFPRPRALMATEAVTGGLWMLALSGVLAGVTLLFSRRAIVRIRRAGRNPGDEPRKLLEQLRALHGRRRSDAWGVNIQASPKPPCCDRRPTCAGPCEQPSHASPPARASSPPAGPAAPEPVDGAPAAASHSPPSSP